MHGLRPSPVWISWLDALFCVIARVSCQFRTWTVLDKVDPCRRVLALVKYSTSLLHVGVRSKFLNSQLFHLTAAVLICYSKCSYSIL